MDASLRAAATAVIDRTVLRYGLVGIGNTILGLGTIYIGRQFVSDFAANLIAYLIVVPVSFVTHRDWSFRDAGKRFPAFVRFLPTVGIGYLINLGVLNAGLAAGVNAYVVQAAAIAVYVGTTYLLSRYVVFLQPR